MAHCIALLPSILHNSCFLLCLFEAINVPVILQKFTWRLWQVPLLLNLGEEARALGKAVDSGDPDLVHLAIFKMYKARPLPEVLATINASKPLARSLFLAYCGKTACALAGM